jgi:Ca2+-binding EF-hand superfamily protein
MRAEAIDRVKLRFSLFDVDGNGYLEAPDFDLMAERVVQAVPEAGEAPKEAVRAAFRTYWTALAGELDANHDGRISFDEYVACLDAPGRFDRAVSGYAESVAALADPDGDGFIERPVFVALMTAIGFEPANISSLFDALGPTDDDRLSTAAWVTGIKEYYSLGKAGIPGDRLVGDPTA